MNDGAPEKHQLVKLLIDTVSIPLRLAVTTLQKLLEAESSSAGRVNLFGMFLGFIAIIVLAIPPFIEGLVKLVRPDASLGLPFWPLLGMFFLFTLACSIMLALLKKP